MTEEFCLNATRNSGVSAGVDACENGAVQYYSKDYYFCNDCTKDKRVVYFLKFSINFSYMVDWGFFSKCATVKAMF